MIFIGSLKKTFFLNNTIESDPPRISRYFGYSRYLERFQKKIEFRIELIFRINSNFELY